MPDIFGRETLLGGVMSAEATRLTFSSPDAASPKMAGLIVQQVNITYSQNITRLYALEDSSVYFVAGRTDGSLSIQHVLGPQGLLVSFIRAYSDVCKIQGKVFVFTLSSGCGTFAASGLPVSVEGSVPVAKVTLKHPVITSINLQAQSQNMILGSGLQAMFVSMDMAETAGAGQINSYNSAD